MVKKGDTNKTTAHKLAKKQRGDKDIVVNYEYRGIKKSGEIIWLDQYSKPFMYRDKPANFITLIDITERKKAEEKLKESEARFSTAFYLNSNCKEFVKM